MASERIGWDLAVYIFFGVVDHFMRVILRQSIVGLQRIGVERRSCLDVCAHFLLQC